MSDYELIALTLFFLGCDIKLYKTRYDEERFLDFIKKSYNLLFQEEEMNNARLEEGQE